jgi:hypothetical protein
MFSLTWYLSQGGAVKLVKKPLREKDIEVVLRRLD